MPDAQIGVVELDPGMTAAGKQYFGLRETDKVRFIESDGRVYLDRHKDTMISSCWMRFASSAFHSIC